MLIITEIDSSNKGGLSELWKISWPMILAAMSNYFMTLADRMIVSSASTDAFIAITNSHPILWMNIRAFMAFIIMTSVSIGQFNGSKNFLQIRKVVWQTIAIVFLYYIVLIPCALNAKIFLADTIEELGSQYLSISLLFLPFHLAGFGAIGSFFLGIGKTKIIPKIVLLSNLVNIGLDCVLIFGIGPIPALGIRGAAYATGIANILSFIIFMCAFLRKEYRDKFQTHRPKFSLSILKINVTIGLPNALNSLINSGGLALVTQIVAKSVSSEELLAFSIASSIFSFFWFPLDGLGKGVCTLCSNYIGRNQLHLIYQLGKSVIISLLIFVILTAVIMVIYPSLIVKLFYTEQITLEFFQHVKWMLFWTWLALLAEGVRWMLQNTLIAANDVRYTVVSNILCFWISAACPIIIFLYYFRVGGAVLCWQFFTVDPCCRAISNMTRLCSSKWKCKATAIAQGL